MPILVLGKKKYEFDAMEFTAKEALAIEKATGLDFQTFLRTAAVDTTARIALVWMVLRHNGQPNLQFHDVDFPIGDFDLEPDAEQLAQIEKAKAEEEGNPPVGDDLPVESPNLPAVEASISTAGTTGSRRRSTSVSKPLMP